MFYTVIYIFLLGIWYTLIGHWIFKRIEIKSNDLCMVALSFLMGYGIIGCFVFLLGVLGSLSRLILIVFIVFSSVFLVKEILWIGRFFRTYFFKINLRPIEILLLILLLLFILFSLSGSASPPVVGDDYHKTLVKLFSQRGEIYNIIDIPYSTLPMLVEMPMMLGFIIHSDILAQLHGFLLGLAFIALIYAIARRFSSRSVALLATVISYSTVVLIDMTRGLKSDIGHTVFILGGIYILCEFFEKTSRKRLLVLSGLFFGFAAASKLNTAAYTIAMMLIIFFYLIVEKRMKIVHSIKYSIIFSLFAFMVVLPWLVNSYFETGNPVHPYFTKMFHTENLWWTNVASEKEMKSTKDFCDVERNTASFLLIPWNMTMHPNRFRSLWIPPLILTFLPFVRLKKLSKNEKWLLYFCLIAGIFWFIISPLLRFGFSIFALLTIGATKGIDIFYQKSRTFNRFIAVSTFTAAIALQIAGTFYHSYNSIAYWCSTISRNEYLKSEYQSLTEYRYYQDDYWISQNLPENSTILSFYPQRYGGYYRNRNTLSFVTLNIILEASKKTWQLDNFIELLKKQKIGYILIDEKYSTQFPLIYKFIRELEKNAFVETCYQRKNENEASSIDVKILELSWSKNYALMKKFSQ